MPSLNAGTAWQEIVQKISEQDIDLSVLVIDSGSSDSTVEVALQADFDVQCISVDEFNHGGTRQSVLDSAPDFDIYCYMTQDALPADMHAVSKLVDAFSNPRVGAVYGRQLPRIGSGPIEAHARLFNYPDRSDVSSMSDAARKGIKAAFMSNSFAAYRRSVLIEVGGFPLDVILGEDTVVAARMLMAGWQIAYVAEAKVFHSHDYNYLQEFRRYFDIGVLHARESWMLQRFGTPEGEGGRFVRSEIRYLWNRAPWLIPSAMLRTTLKYSGYRLGRIESVLPLRIKKLCSMHKGFWVTDR